MIKTYNEFSNNIILEILNVEDFNFLNIIKEEWSLEWKYNFYVKDNKEKLNITNDNRKFFQSTEETLKKYIENNINPYQGKFVDKYNQNIIKCDYNMSLTEHYITKFLRKDFEDLNGSRGIINPGLYEGINLIYKNKNEITRMIVTNFIQNKSSTLAKMIGPFKYSIIFAIDLKDKRKYEITLVSQMKGIEYEGFKGKIIKLHPDGDRY